MLVALNYDDRVTRSPALNYDDRITRSPQLASLFKIGLRRPNCNLGSFAKGLSNVGRNCETSTDLCLMFYILQYLRMLCINVRAETFDNKCIKINIPSNFNYSN